nr:MAG TPA: hypothetical protein [Caudoviricetes sp.]
MKSSLLTLKDCTSSPKAQVINWIYCHILMILNVG